MGLDFERFPIFCFAENLLEFPLSKFFPLRVDPFFQRFCHPGSEIGSQKGVPLKKKVDKLADLPIHFSQVEKYKSLN